MPSEVVEGSEIPIIEGILKPLSETGGRNEIFDRYSFLRIKKVITKATAVINTRLIARKSLLLYKI